MSEAALSRQAIAQRAAKTRWALLLPALVTIIVIGIAPLFIILTYSFLVPDAYGGVKWIFTLDNYIQFLFQRDIFDNSLGFDASYLMIFSRSALQALLATFISLILGFPTAYYIATREKRYRNILAFLITIPFWTNLLIRTYAMMLLLRDDGLINAFLLTIHVIDKPIPMIYTNFAIAVGLVYTYIPFMVLPIYASIEKLDFRLVEAGFDLYANRFQVLRRVIIPLARPGIIAGCLLVFIPSLGTYITSALLGGGNNLLIGNLIAIQFGESRNWSFGSALTIILMMLVLFALYFYIRQSPKEGAGHG